MTNENHWRYGHSTVWGPPVLLVLLLALVVDAGDKQPLVMLAGVVLALPYLIAATVAWRTWRSPWRTLATGLVSAGAAFGLLLLVF